MLKSKLEFFLQLISKANDSHRPNYNNTEHAVIGKVYDAVNITNSDITDHTTMTILKQVYFYTASQDIRKFIYTPT
jgi:hypothetical protein